MGKEKLIIKKDGENWKDKSTMEINLGKWDREFQGETAIYNMVVRESLTKKVEFE